MSSPYIPLYPLYPNTHLPAWGKRDYYCLNTIQGIPESSTLSPGDHINIHFNRNPTEHCSNPLTEFPGSDYKLWLVNAPTRNLDTINFEHSVIFRKEVDEAKGTVGWTVPKNLPKVEDSSLWYLRLDATLATAPQVNTLSSLEGYIFLVMYTDLF